MSKLQIGLIIALMIALVALIIIFWGSIASALFIFLLIVIPVELAFSKFLVNRENSDFDDTN